MNEPGRALLHLALLAPLAALVTSPRVARAQPSDIDACIEASENAVTLRKAGKLIDERTSLSRCAAPACPDPVNTSCRERLSEANRAIPTIVFATKDRAGHDLPAVKLSIDGIPYPGRLDGSAIPLDPGDHEFRFEIAGAEPVVQHFVLYEREQARRETVVVGAREGDREARRAIALAVGGVGVAGLLVGAVFGALSLTAHNAYEQDCGPAIGAPAGRCNAKAVPGESDAATKGTIATALFIGGGAVTALGAAWYLLERGPRTRKGIQVGLGPRGVVLEGEF